jgi:hypothetical protein
MKKGLFHICFVVLLASSNFAQAQRPETNAGARFDGTWVLDENYKKTFGDMTWVIKTTGDELKIRMTADNKTDAFDLVLFTDKRGETNSSRYGNNQSGIQKSKTYWKKGVLVREYHSLPARSGTGIESRGTDRYRLSEDGQRLILTRQATMTPALIGSLSYRLVFSKVGK